MIGLRSIDHVALGTPDVHAATLRWTAQFGLTTRSCDARRALLSCEDEPYSLELMHATAAGHLHTGFELARGCSLDDAEAHLRAHSVLFTRQKDSIDLVDPEGRGIELVATRPRPPYVNHVLPSATVRPGAPRRLGHVNCLTARMSQSLAFYTEILGMQVTDWLGDQGCWLHVTGDHHVMALIDTGEAHFHHLAFDVIDIGQMRDILDRLARHGRWLGWGPVRHGVGGNIASYVRIVEEECFCELYCDMEQLAEDHLPRTYPDDRRSSNTWGPLPPRSYFRFDEAAVRSERESLETLGTVLEPLVRTR